MDPPLMSRHKFLRLTLRPTSARAEGTGTARTGDAHEAPPTGRATSWIWPDVKAGPPPPRRPRRLFRRRPLASILGLGRAGRVASGAPGDNRPDAERRPTDRARDRLRAARG